MFFYFLFSHNSSLGSVDSDNATTIPIQHGEALLIADNKIIVIQDSYYMVFGQVQK